MIPLAYNIRNLAVRKTTTLATLIGIALVVFVFSAAFMLANGIKKTLASSGRHDDAMIMRQGSDAEMTSSLEEATVGLLLSKEQVAHAASGAPLGVGEIVVVATLDKLGTDGVSNVTIRGVPETVYDFRPEVRIVAGRRAKPGTDEVVIGRAIRGRFKGVDLDQTFELKKNRLVKVVGVFDSQGSAFDSEVWSDLDTVRAAFGRQGLYTSARVRLTSAAAFDAFKADVESDKRLGLAVQREDAYYEKQSSGMSTFILGLAIGIVVFISLGAMIGASITMYAQVASRTREIGTLRALGFGRASILGSFLLESLILAVAGGTVGALLSLGLKLASFSMINFTTWSEIVISFEPKPSIVLGSLAFGAFMGILGGFLPALRASRVSPVQAMRA